jgi:hypothetical protein
VGGATPMALNPVVQLTSACVIRILEAIIEGSSGGFIIVFFQIVFRFALSLTYTVPPAYIVMPTGVAAVNRAETMLKEP